MNRIKIIRLMERLQKDEKLKEIIAIKLIEKNFSENLKNDLKRSKAVLHNNITLK